MIHPAEHWWRPPVREICQFYTFTLTSNVVGDLVRDTGVKKVFFFFFCMCLCIYIVLPLQNCTAWIIFITYFVNAQFYQYFSFLVGKCQPMSSTSNCSAGLDIYHDLNQRFLKQFFLKLKFLTHINLLPRSIHTWKELFNNQNTRMETFQIKKSSSNF